MKKWLCALAALAIMACGLTGYAVDGFVNFDSNLSGAFTGTAEDAMMDSRARAGLTAALGTDLAKALEGGELAFSPAFFEDSYVGRDDISLFVYLPGDAQDALIVYVPDTRNASYMLAEHLDAEMVTDLLNEFCVDGYIQNEPADMILAVEWAQGR